MPILDFFLFQMKRVEINENQKSKSCLQPADLLFARRSLVAEGAGKCIIVMEIDEPTTFESSIIRARPDPFKANSLFLYYLFNSPHGRYLLESIRRQVAVSGITGTDLVQLYIPLPSLQKQHSIAHILGSLDDKIELNRQMNQTLEVMAQAIFKSWFVDFDPVHAKATGNDTGLPKEISGLFPDSFENTKLGPIPKGWEVKSLDEIADFLNGIACQKQPPKNREESLPVIKIRELRQGVTKNSDRASIDISLKYIVEDGDILFSWSGSLLVDVWCHGRGVLNQHVFKVTSELFPKWFYFHWIKHHLVEFQRVAADKVTTMGHIKRHHLTDAKVCIPSIKFLNLTNEQLSPILEQQIKINLESKELSKIRDTLLPKLISGEMRVPEMEKFLEHKT